MPKRKKKECVASIATTVERIFDGTIEIINADAAKDIAKLLTQDEATIEIAQFGVRQLTKAVLPVIKNAKPEDVVMFAWAGATLPVLIPVAILASIFSVTPSNEVDTRSAEEIIREGFMAGF